MTSAETAIEIFQSINTVIACICSFFLHGYMIRRIKLNAASLTHYQNFLVLQSVVYILGSALRLILNERPTLNMEIQNGYPFIALPSWLASVLSPACVFVETGESMLLTLFNIQRVLLFLKPGKIGLFYIVSLPIAFFVTVLVGISSSFFGDISYYCTYAYYVVILGIVFVCYFILRRHFRLNYYSDVIRRAQNKMSRGLLIQIFVQIFALVIVGIGSLLSLMASLFRLSKNTVDEVVGIYLVYTGFATSVIYWFLVIYVIFIWFPLLIGFIIKWSISGLLTIKQSQRHSWVSIEVTVVKAKAKVET